MELEEAIKKLKEKIEGINIHLRNYEIAECFTATYENLKSEKEAIEIVLNQLMMKEKMIKLMSLALAETDFDMCCDLCRNDICTASENTDERAECVKYYWEKKIKEE